MNEADDDSRNDSSELEEDDLKGILFYKALS